jgi:glycosyltransferase involved in cell wall biosynthesis
VTLGSSELVKNLSKYNSRTTLITCPVPDLKIVKKEKNEILTIGWIGDFTKGHKQSLMETFFPAISNLPFRIKLVMLGVERKNEYEFLTDHLKTFNNILLEIPQSFDWHNEVQVQTKISTFDIGIATLIDDEFYRSKSAFKLKQYLNNGVPVLSSDLPENNVFLKHGKNGYLCNTSSEFLHRITEFNSMDADTYSVFSANARQSVPSFDLRNFCERLILAYQSEN